MSTLPDASFPFLNIFLSLSFLVISREKKNAYFPSTVVQT